MTGAHTSGGGCGLIRGYAKNLILVLTCTDQPGESRATPSGGTCTGAAWLSSARVARRRVQSLNERNPCVQLPARHGGDSGRTAGVKPEEGGDDVKSSWPLCPGLHTCYNGPDRASPLREQAPIAETGPQSGLRAATRPHEGGVASNPESACRGECVPGSCTHRPSRHGSREYPKSAR